MNLFHTVGAAALVCLAGAGLSSCLNAPDYSDTPRIDVNGVTVFKKTGAAAGKLGNRDSVEIALNFQDGTGDLGLGNADTIGVYTHRGGNRYFNNYFINVYYKDKASGTFLPFPLPANFTYNGRFFRLTKTDARPGPLKGVLRYAIVLSSYSPETVPGTMMRFEVSIADRALHESNVVTTDPATL